MLRRKEDTKKHGSAVDKASGDECASEQSKGKTSQKKKDLLEKLQQVSADFANYQKRTVRNTEETRQWTKAEMIRSILPAIDDFEQALEAGKTAKDVGSLLEGFKLVHEHLLTMLNTQQVEAIASEGEKFDPAVHEAMLQQESAEHEPGMVITELRKGYTMNGRTLRPARVTVSKSPGREETDECEAGGGSAEQQDSEQ